MGKAFAELGDALGEVGEDPAHALGVGTGERAEFWARRILEAAISSMALVILAVDWTERMRRRMTRRLAMGRNPSPAPPPSHGKVNRVIRTGRFS